MCFIKQETRTQCLLLRASDHRRQSELQSDDAGGGSGRQQQLGAARASWLEAWSAQAPGSETEAAWAAGSGAGPARTPGSEAEGGAGCRAAARGSSGIGGDDGCRPEAESRAAPACWKLGVAALQWWKFRATTAMAEEKATAAEVEGDSGTPKFFGSLTAY
jgi:hypothetical protein